MLSTRSLANLLVTEDPEGDLGRGVLIEVLNRCRGSQNVMNRSLSRSTECPEHGAVFLQKREEYV